jgi:hypothetical protein
VRETARIRATHLPGVRPFPTKLKRPK